MTISNGTTYNSIEVEIKGNTYSVLRAHGEANYFNVTKVTNNPFGGPGKHFATADDLLANYSSPAFKTAMLFALEDLGVNF